MTSATVSTTPSPFLVVCSHADHPAHAWIIDAESSEVAISIGRYRYQLATDVLVPESIEVSAVAYANLPEIMFGGARV
jgi:hypothetical protein